MIYSKVSNIVARICIYSLPHLPQWWQFKNSHSMFVKTKKSSLFQITDFICISPVSLKCPFSVPTSYPGTTLHLCTIYPYYALSCDSFSHFLIFMVWEFWRVGIRHFVGYLFSHNEVVWWVWRENTTGVNCSPHYLGLIMVKMMYLPGFSTVKLLFSPFFRSKSLILTHPQEK